MTEVAPQDAVVRDVRVPVPPAHAFTVFTAEMGRWWPLVTHSVHELDSAGVELEPRVGGRIVERSVAGETCVWGTVEVWRPGVEVAFTWHPGTEPDEATSVSVRFEPVPDGTRVVLVHTGWSRRPDGERARRAYGSGWVPVLTRYGAAAGVGV